MYILPPPSLPHSLIPHPLVTMGDSSINSLPLRLFVFRRKQCTQECDRHYQQLLVATRRQRTHTRGKYDGWDGAAQSWPPAAEAAHYGEENGQQHVMVSSPIVTLVDHVSARLLLHNHHIGR